MTEPIRRIRKRLRADPPADQPKPFALLQAAAAQLLIATGTAAAIEHRKNLGTRASSARVRRDVPVPLAWAPVLVGSLAAFAHLEHVRRPSERTGSAVRVLDAASVTIGAALFIADLVTGENGSGSRLSPLSFASAGLLGVTLERQERAIRETEDELRRRASVVERLVPHRKARLDRIVVHV